jgi:hypothetical protein
LLVFLVRDCFERSVNNLKRFSVCWRSAYVLLSCSIPVVSSICTIGTSHRLPCVSDSQLCVLGVRELHPIKVLANKSFVISHHICSLSISSVDRFGAYSATAKGLKQSVRSQVTRSKCP